MIKGLISVIVPSRVGEKNKSLPSIKKQTYKKVEIIEVVDKEERGAAATRNKGLKKAKGEFIFYCDNDVELEPDCLENLFNCLKENKDADWAFGRFSIDGNEFNKNKGAVPERDFTREFIDYFMGISTMSLIRSKCNPYMDEEMLRFDDWDMWIRLYREGHKPVFCNKFLFSTFNKPSGISRQDGREVWMSRLYRKNAKRIADVIIPHHDQHKLLARCLEGIDNSMFNIIIVSGGTFGENCNKGAKLAETDNLIFLNDDTEPVNEVLIRMVEDANDITGIAQYSTSHRIIFYGIGWRNDFVTRFLAKTPEDVEVPSGFCFKIKKDAWKKLRGFNRKFRNGAEDIDLFLRARGKKMKIGYLTDYFNHDISKSGGRFDFANVNDKMLDEIWTKKIFKNRKKKQEGRKGNIVTNNFYFKGKLYNKGEYVCFDSDTQELVKGAGCFN